MKKHFDPNQERAPAGSTTGGEWVNTPQVPVSVSSPMKLEPDNNRPGMNFIGRINVDGNINLVYKVNDFMGKLPPGGYLAVKVRGPDKGEILFGYNEMNPNMLELSHSQIVEAAHPNGTVDTYVRYYILKHYTAESLAPTGHILNTDINYATMVDVRTDADKSQALDWIYKSTDILRRAGLPEDTPVRIQNEGYQAIDTTLGKISVDQDLAKHMGANRSRRAKRAARHEAMKRQPVDMAMGKYDPDQARAPKGSAAGGEWTGGGFSQFTAKFGTNKKQNISIGIEAWKSKGVTAREINNSDPKWIREGIKKRGAAYYDAETDAIIINQYNSFWSNPKEYMTNMEKTRPGYFSSFEIDHVLTHEYGHYLYQDTNRYDNESYFSNNHDVRDQVKQTVSEYAAQNIHEFIAEVYTGKQAGKDYPEPIMNMYRDAKIKRTHFSGRFSGLTSGWQTPQDLPATNALVQKVEMIVHKYANRILPETILQRLIKAMGYNPENYALYIYHGVGRFMADQIDEAYFRKITNGTIEHGLLGAWVQGMEDNGLTRDDMTPIWQIELNSMIEHEKSFLDRFIQAMKNGKQNAEDGSTDYNDELDKALKRAKLWGRRYEDIRQRAQRITGSHAKAIKLAGKRKAIRMIWRLGDAEHCDTCRALDGVCAYSWEFDNAGYWPRDPDGKLECHGFNCACTLEPTNLPRSRRLERITLDVWIPQRMAALQAAKMDKYDIISTSSGQGLSNT